MPCIQKNLMIQYYNGDSSSPIDLQIQGNYNKNINRSLMEIDRIYLNSYGHPKV